MGGGVILRVLAGALLIAMGLYLADWWRGLTKLEALGRYLWVYLQPVSKRLMPVNSLPKALMLGAVWGWLPCGLVYAALAMAMTQPAPLLAGSAMLAFGLGTLPAVLAAGIATQTLTSVLQRRGVRWGLAVIIILFGCWTIWGAIGHLGHHSAEHHHSSGPHSRGSETSNNNNNNNSNASVSDHSATEHDHDSRDQSPTSGTLERQRTDIKEVLTDNNLAANNSSAASSSSSSTGHGDTADEHLH
jgi:hypothetical protein